MEYSYIDLHIHSIFSNEENCNSTPEELLNKAQAIAENYDKTCVISITDHHSILGSKEAIELIQANPNRWPLVKVISGIELNVGLKEIEKSGSNSAFSKCHCLGYNYDINNEELLTYSNLMNISSKYCKSIINTGEQLLSALKIIENKTNLTIPFSTYKNCLQLNNNHIDIREMFVKTTEAYLDEHYSKINGNNIYKGSVISKLVASLFSARVEYKPEAVGKAKINIVKAVKMIKDAGGDFFIAHPNSIRYNQNSIGGKNQFVLLDKFIGKLQSLTNNGLSGLETFHNMNTFSEAMINIIKLAEKYNLYISAGSDHHGPNLHKSNYMGKVTCSKFDALTIGDSSGSRQRGYNIVNRITKLAYVSNMYKTEEMLFENKQSFELFNFLNGILNKEDCYEIIYKIHIGKKIKKEITNITNSNKNFLNKIENRSKNENFLENKQNNGTYKYELKSKNKNKNKNKKKNKNKNKNNNANKNNYSGKNGIVKILGKSKFTNKQSIKSNYIVKKPNNAQDNISTNVQDVQSENIMPDTFKTEEILDKIN